MSVENDEKRAKMADAFFLIRTFHMLSSFGIRWVAWKKKTGYMGGRKTVTKVGI